MLSEYPPVSYILVREIGGYLYLDECGTHELAHLTRVYINMLT